jgi:methylenetetrahydrofolate dehydrogenase (NADP+) / methenyltetrahydrofolate cyclohydrolase
MILKSTLIQKHLFNQLLALRQSIPDSLRLDIVLATQDPASVEYVSKKIEYGRKLNIEVMVHESFEAIDLQTSNGIIIQLPSTPQETDYIKSIPLELDVDLLNHFQRLVDLGIYPPTINSIYQLINHHYNSTNLKGKNIVIIGQGQLVGYPLAQTMMKSGATVISCNQYTKDIKQLTQLADIVISATGNPNLIDTTYTHPTQPQLFIDAGTSGVNGVIIGDIQDTVGEVDNITLVPCPNGVGPLTVYSLFNNLIMLHLHFKRGKQRT